MIYFNTIVLDGMPWITHHLPVFERLKVPWRWIIAEGVAEPVKDTNWCKPIPARLSNDGTTEYLNELKRHPRVTVLQAPLWPGKTSMFQAMLPLMMEPGLLWQVDSDELWNDRQLSAVTSMFQAVPQYSHARFWCDYRVGMNLRMISRGAYGNNPGEWLRVWRYQPGMYWERHEPPVMVGVTHGVELGNEDTERMGCVFLHPAYALEKQLAFKEAYYGYAGAVEQWRALQANTTWPVKAKNYLRWITDESLVDLVTNSTTAP